MGTSIPKLEVLKNGTILVTSEWIVHQLKKEGFKVSPDSKAIVVIQRADWGQDEYEIDVGTPIEVTK